MKYKSRSIRTFIGAKNYQISVEFYKELGYDVHEIDPKMSYIRISESIGFYLQDYYVKKWVDNSMVFLEVDNLDDCREEIITKGLANKYKNVRIGEIITEEWGREFHLWDPSGVLWHFGEFSS